MTVTITEDETHREKLISIVFDMFKFLLHLQWSRSRRWGVPGDFELLYACQLGLHHEDGDGGEENPGEGQPAGEGQ